MLELIEKENLSSNNKIAKPDLATRTGREFLSYYLQAKLRQLVLYDAKEFDPIIKSVKSDFIFRFAKSCKRLQIFMKCLLRYFQPIIILMIFQI